MVYLLEIALLLVLILSLRLNKNDFTAPSFLFVLSFSFSVAWAIAYKEKWQLNLHINTFVVILSGALVFVVVGYLTHLLFKNKLNSFPSDIDYRFVKGYSLNPFITIVFIVLIFATFFITLFEIRSLTGENNFSKAINIYRNANAYYDSDLKLSPITYYLGIIVRAAGYWFSFFLGGALGFKDKVNKLGVIAFIGCLLFSLLSGGRNDFVSLLFSTIVIYLVSRNYYIRHSNNELDIKLLLRIISIAFIIIVLFAYLTSIIGRTIANSDYLYYLAIYCGASIKNLDLFLSHPIIHSDYWGQFTFVNLLNYIGNRFNIDALHFSAILNYNYIGNYRLGNVYTTYFAFVKDFGYFGSIALVSLMAFISQSIFELMLKLYRQSNIFTILYGFTSGLLILSFFSNKFYENFFDINLIKYVIVWIILNVIYNKQRYKIHIKIN